MARPPDPEEIFDRAVDEGDRRLDQSLLELVSTSFIAGFTVVYGVVALGLLHALVPPAGGSLDTVAGALAFAPALVFLVVGRTELFNENFFDPAAKAVDATGTWMVGSLLRLWSVTFAMNLLGGVLFAAVFTIEGVLPSGAVHTLRTFAHEIVRRPSLGVFASGIVGGALVTLLSYLLQAADSTGSRAATSFVVGFLLVLGTFDHSVVTALHLSLGILLGAGVELLASARAVAVVTAGNLVGGIGFVVLTHVTQVVGARESEGE